MDNFINLHLHSEYSLLDGACRISDIIKRVKELGQTAVAITDHGVMYGVIDFYKQAKQAGILPIIGCEVYIAKRTRFDKEFKIDSKSYHLILLCKNNIGYKNLIKIVSNSFIDGFYIKPRIDKQLLEKHCDGLICLSACMGGELARNALNNDYEEMRKTAKYYYNLFKNDYYIELQDYGTRECEIVNKRLIDLAKNLNIPLVATNDVHYVYKEDAKMHQVLLCIQTNSNINAPNMEFSSKEFYMKSEQEMLEKFNDLPEAITNTQKIAEKCDVKFEFNVTKLPSYKADESKTNEEFFEEVCYIGLKRLYGENCDQSLKDRLKYEISTIKIMGYVDYFLIVMDFINYAKENGISVGPGRGSGAGSLVAYCIAITGIDPIKYNLIFERFLNPERISMPDFDIDFCYERRQEVIDYVIKKYGKDHVAQIVTFGSMAAKMAIRDVARVMNFSYSLADTIAKLIPIELNITIEKALKIVPEIKNMYDTNNEVKEILDMARKIEGMPRHCSTHAAGVVITKDPVDTFVPLQKTQNNITTQFSMGTLEELGLLKMDFLGLKCLTVISDTEKLIRKNNPSFNINNISMDKAKVFELLSLGHGKGVFQFETSSGIRQVLVNFKPESIEDLIAIVSLYRPGPIESIPKYIQNKNNKDKIIYKHPLLKPILEVTYGCIVYQEQVMQICRELAGYSFGRADLVRRAMSKKKSDVMEQERHNFIYGKKNDDGTVECIGALANGVPENVADNIFNEMNNFAAYAFNKSHATAYAILSYQTAYLKCFYPKAYFASLLTSVIDNKDKIKEYIDECNRIGIDILPPNINKSRVGFIIEEGKLRFGLAAIKGVGKNFIKLLERERDAHGNFTGFQNFCERMHEIELNKRTIESLVKSGSFDGLKMTRKTLLRNYEKIFECVANNIKKTVFGQMSLLDQVMDEDIKEDLQKDESELSLDELADLEKESIGIYLSAHPLKEYEDYILKNNIMSIADLSDLIFKHVNKVVIIGIIVTVCKILTKNNEEMVFCTIEDRNSSIELIIFSKVYKNYRNLIIKGKVIVVEGELDSKEEKYLKILAKKIFEPKEVEQNEKANFNLISKSELIVKKGIYLKIDEINSQQYRKVDNMLKIFDGNTKVYILFTNESKLKLAPSNMWVDINVTLIAQLEEILGKDNVKLI